MRSDIYRLERISLVGHQLLQVIESRSITRDTLVRDVETQWLVTTPLYNIGSKQTASLGNSLKVILRLRGFRLLDSGIGWSMITKEPIGI